MTALPTNFHVTTSQGSPQPTPDMPIPAPILITPNAQGLTAPPFPLNHARILYRNELFTSLSVTATSGTDPLNAIKPNTYEAFTFTGNTELVATLSANQQVDTICIGAHNLGDDGGTVTVSIDDNESDPVTVSDSIAVTDNTPIMFHFPAEYSAKRVIVSFTASTANEKRIAYISAGVSLQMQRPFFSGHNPINNADVTSYYNNRTQSGNIIGQEVRRLGFKTAASWKNLDDGWYRNYIPAFKESSKTLPFFFAWNLLEYPQDVGFCRISEDISAPYSGVRNLRTLDINLLGV